MLYALIPTKWMREEDPEARPIQIECSFKEALELNELGYGLYYYPNGVSQDALETLPIDPKTGQRRFLQAEDINEFHWVLLDMDMKHNAHKSEAEFIEKLLSFHCPPTKIVSSGGGIHAYWRVSDLDAMSMLRLSRRVCRYFNSDPAISQIKQLMRVPGSWNTKIKDKYRPCDLLDENDNVYSCEQLDRALPPITAADEQFCQQHFDRTYNADKELEKVSTELPLKFKKLLRDSREVKELYAGDVADRSAADYRLAHILFAQGFAKEEAMSVLVNCRKAIERSPANRLGYAALIADKIWTFENAEDKSTVQLSNSVRDILRRGEAIKGTRFPCWEVFDGTHYGFRLSHVLGLVGGSGSGKTTLALNYFYHFARLNPEYVHLFVSLEQPEEEIAMRWARMVGDNDHLHDKVHVLGNYNPDGSYRHLSLGDIQDYILRFEKETKQKVGCCVVDHIGILKKSTKDGESQGLIDICHQMKAVAKACNVFLVMQSQTSREKAGIGDVELNKDAAFGTSMFENYCDFLVTTHQPLKRIYDQKPEMACNAFKYAKIRHKNVKLDKTKEDVLHVLMFDPETERLRLMNQEEEELYDYWNTQATKLRNKDRKREPTRHTKIDWTDGTEKDSA